MNTVNVKIYNPTDNITYKIDLSPEDAVKLTEDHQFAMALLNHAVKYKKTQDKIREQESRELQAAHDSATANDVIDQSADGVEQGAGDDSDNQSIIEEDPAAAGPLIGHVPSRGVASIEENPISPQSELITNDATQEDFVPGEVASKHNWQYDETKALIASYDSHKEKFNHPKKRKFAWENIANDMVSAKYTVTADLCRIKWNNLLKSHKIRVDGNKATGTGPSRFMFFDLLHDVIGKKPNSTACPHAMASMQQEDNTVVGDDPPLAVEDSGRLKNKRKASKAAECDRRQKQRDDRLQIQKDKIELRAKLMNGKFKLKKIIQEEKAALKATQRQNDLDSKRNLQQDVQKLKTEMQREKLAMKAKLMEQKFEFENKKMELENTKIALLNKYFANKSNGVPKIVCKKATLF